MAINNFIPEVWAASLLSVLEKSLVFGNIANRDYEGEISQFGDTVHINSIADPTIAAYTKNTNLSDPEALTDSEQLMLIDQANSFNFQVDSIDRAQVRNSGGLFDEATRRAGFGLRDLADQFLAKKIALASSATNALGVIDGTTATNLYDALLVPASVKLDEANVPEEMRWMVLSPAAYGKLQLDARFVRQNESGTSALHNGVVGDAAGFRIYKSNNATQVNRTVASTTTVSGSKNLTAAAGSFTQADVGATITGTGIGASNKIASVGADGSTAVTTVNQSAAGSVTVTLSGSGQAAYYGSSMGLTYAQQILEVDAYKPEKRFGDALKGLHVFGAKVVRPTALGVAGVKVS